MSVSSRLYYCCRCHAPVIVCSRCDRGHRYCAGECRHQARTESLRRAGKKYQSTRAGKFNNAHRQQQFRARQCKKVTHQGSCAKPLHALLHNRLEVIKKTPKPSFSDATCHCHFCGAVCDPFLRQDFLHSSRFHPVMRRSGSL